MKKFLFVTLVLALALAACSAPTTPAADTDGEDRLVTIYALDG